MVEQLTIINKNTGTSVVMDRDSANYLIDDEGLDWGYVSESVSASGNLDGYGSKINKINISEPRAIHIIGWVIGTESQMGAKKRTLSQVIVPKNNIRILIIDSQQNEYYIDTVVDKSLHFGTTVRTNNECMCQFEFYLSAYYPFFQRDLLYTGLSGSAAIENSGDIPVGFYISIGVTSSATDPYFGIQGGGYYKSVNFIGSFSSGEQITYDTRYASKTVARNGSKNFGILNSSSELWVQIPIKRSSSDSVAIHLSSGLTVSRLEYAEGYSILEDL